MNKLIPYIESNNLTGLERELRGRCEPKSLNEALLCAVDLGSADCASLLIQQGADCSIKQLDTGWSLLHIAVEHSAFDLVRNLVRGGIDVGVQDRHGATPLHLAVDVAADTAQQTGEPLDTGVVKLLLALGADSTVEDETGATPADWASRVGCSEIEKVLRG